MPAPTEPRFEDGASSEAWFQKGATLLKGRKMEEKLRRRMAQPVMHEWQFWIGMMWVLWLFFGTDETIRFIATVSAVISFAVAIDGAAAKRTQAMLEWLEYQKTKGKLPGIDSPPPAS